MLCTYLQYLSTVDDALDSTCTIIAKNKYFLKQNFETYFNYGKSRNFTLFGGCVEGYCVRTMRSPFFRGIPCSSTSINDLKKEGMTFQSHEHTNLQLV